MPDFTIVTTTATQGSDEAEVNTLSDEFANESEAFGYSRRMTDEMLGLAGPLALDFDYCNVGLYEGDLADEELDPTHPACIGVWLMDEADGAAFVPAGEIREGGEPSNEA